MSLVKKEKSVVEVLIEVSEKYEKNTPNKWGMVAEEMFEAVGVEKTPEQWRRLYRYYAIEKKGSKGKGNTKDIEKAGGKEESIYDSIKKHMNKVQKIEDLAEKIGLSVNVVKGYLLDLKSQGFNIAYELNGLVWMDKSVEPTYKSIRVSIPRVGDTIRLAAVSDTHLCSKWQQLTHLNKFYDECVKENVNLVLHSGDWVDGDYSNKRREHLKEVFVWGADDQANYVAKVYPYRKGILTKGITGNHDATFTALSGTNILTKICHVREDIENLGYVNAKVWLTEKCDVDLYHPADGSAYAASYSLQRYIDNLAGGEKPRILLTGHHHKSFYMPYRNIHAFEVPGFIAQTPWAKSKRIGYVVGAWMLELEVMTTGEVVKIKQVYYPYYEAIPEDYVHEY